MKKYVIEPKKEVKLKDDILPSVNSYIKKAIALGKEMFGNDFILREKQSDFFGDFYETWNVYDCDGNLIANKNGRIKKEQE